VAGADTADLGDAEHPMRALGRRLDAARHRRGWTYREFEQHTGISKSTLQYMLRKRRTAPDYYELKALVDRLGETWDEAWEGLWQRAVDVTPIPADSPAAGRPAEALLAGDSLQAWNIPPRNPNFTGRADELGSIREGLAAHATMTVHALRGLGGVGKTQLAVEYAYCNAATYDLAWWIDAEHSTTIPDQLATLGAELGLPPIDDSFAAAKAVCRFLRGSSSWLLIFDNAEGPDGVRPFLPGGSGHVLVTTRRTGFRSLGNVLDLDVLDRAHAVALLQHRAAGVSDTAADLLADLLGDLPLALDQAAAYLDRTSVSPEDYLDLLRNRTADIYRTGSPAGYPHTIATVWSLSMDELDATAPAAAQLLRLCAWLASESIPLDLFANNPGQLPSPLAAAAADPLMFAETIASLLDYSLVRRTSYGLVFHRLIQAVSRHMQSQQTDTNLLRAALNLLYADLPTRVVAAPENWPRWRELLRNVLAATGHAADSDPSSSHTTAQLVGLAASHLLLHGRPADALPLFERVVCIRESQHGTSHPDVANALNNVGWALRELGRPAEAQSPIERAIQIWENTRGSSHPDVANALNNLGHALRNQGRPLEAKPLFERARRIDETTHGPEHPDVATGLENLGLVLRDVGRAADAEPLFQRALHIRESHYGPDHPQVTAAMGNLGLALLDLERPTEAVSLFERAAQRRQALMGPDHPYVANALENLGLAFLELDRLIEAHQLLKRVLSIRETAYGASHPLTLRARKNLGSYHFDE
jgi:tetratricopeptide (TPR) repeat protein/transcriptional regulator with XRE-family HTH domain